jgi:hypothetical protein
VLSPRERQLLLENLRPPEGYRLDFAVGTSYSLDLIALLVAPLAFTFYDWEDDEGRPTDEPLALLESVRRHAEHIVLYCQAGEIMVPRHGQPLLAYLEPCVVEVQAPLTGGVFHPKIWLLRYIRDGEPTRYRFLCLSRNLTFDRCWDSLLCMDGQLLDRTNAFSVNHPLGDFIDALPGLAVRAKPEAHAARVAQIAHEVRRVSFEAPPDVEAFAFHPLGLGPRKALPVGTHGGPLLIMSPFVSRSLLDSLLERTNPCTLISRPDELSRLPSDLLERFQERIYILDGAAEEITDETDETPAAGLSGLHAKLFVEDDGWNAHVFTGSANATDAAFNRNVEFLTELVGKKSKLGTRSLLEGGGNDGTGIKQLLKPWSGQSTQLSEEERIRQALEHQLTAARRALAAQPLLFRCVPVPETGFMLEVHAVRNLNSIDGVTVRCWPAILRPDTAISLSSGVGALAAFGPIELAHVTAFLAFELAAVQGDIHARCAFAMRLPLEGLPEDRLERLLASQLSDPEQLLRLLWLLLEPDSAAGANFLTRAPNGNGSWNGYGTDVRPIFEQLIRSIVDAEHRTRDVGRLIEDLARSPEGRALLPAGLLDLWGTIKQWLEGRRVAQG